MDNEDEKFDKIPLWNLGGYPVEFDIFPEFGDRIPIVKIERWEDFSNVVGSSFFKECTNIFRGQRRYDWGVNSIYSKELKDWSCC